MELTECLVMANAAGLCPCGTYQANGAHVVGDAIYGPCCCPVYREREHDWGAVVRGVEGTQGGLFDGNDN